jgi:hypothetical protein
MSAGDIQVASTQLAPVSTITGNLQEASDFTLRVTHY